MEDIITAQSEISIRTLRLLDGCLADINNILENYRPIFNGQRYITDKELSERIKISRRTLNDWRKFGYVDYIQLDGKVLYRESDIEHFFSKFHNKAWADM